MLTLNYILEVVKNPKTSYEQFEYSFSSKMYQNFHSLTRYHA